MERIPVAVVGGGQAGLATSYHLMKQDVEHVVLEAGDRIGSSWRNRWDSLRLFTPARYDGLPGMRFPAASTAFPTKDEMATYLESYASHFSLPVRLSSPVASLSRTQQGFQLKIGNRSMEAQQVVVATGPYQKPRIPAFASAFDRSVVQLHAGEYIKPEQLKNGPVLVVGAGNSGAEIAIEAARAGHRTWLAGRGTGQVPPVAYAFEGRIFWFWANAVLSVNTPIGRKAQPHVIAHGGPLIRLTMNEVTAAGVVRAPRVSGVNNGSAQLEDGRVLDVGNIVWCTGFTQDFSWIDLPVLDANGVALHDRGVATRVPGLYFVGLPFLSKLASAFIGGVGGDAKRLTGAIASAARRPVTARGLGSNSDVRTA